MQLVKNNIYHIYNRGLNKQPIFLYEAHYYFFIKKIKYYLSPVCNILSYCLMPNHFHIIIEATAESVIEKKAGFAIMQQTSYAIQHLLSSYTKAFNKQQNRTGSLFTQNTKCKNISENEQTEYYRFTCINYVHQNPWKARLVARMEDWKFSSFIDFLVDRKDKNIINKERAFQLFNIDKSSFYKESYAAIDEDKLRKIFV